LTVLKTCRRARIAEQEIKDLEQLKSLGMKTPEFYKKITFVDGHSVGKALVVFKNILSNPL
jgi:hypothetical protein